MPRIRLLMLLPPLLFLGLAALFLAGNFREDRDSLPSTMVGRAAPEMRLGALADLPAFDMAALRAGEVTLVNFWASWCPPCRAEHPLLEALADEGIPIYGVNTRDAPEHAVGFLEELGNPYAGIGTSRDGRASMEWGVYGLPETFVVDGNGVIVLRLAGPVTEQELERRIRPAMAQARGE